MLIFRVVEVLAQLFPESSGPLANFAGDLFDILGCYFPIHFTHVRSLNHTVSLLFSCVFSEFRKYVSDYAGRFKIQ